MSLSHTKYRFGHAPASMPMATKGALRRHLPRGTGEPTTCDYDYERLLDALRLGDGARLDGLQVRLRAESVAVVLARLVDLQLGTNSVVVARVVPLLLEVRPEVELRVEGGLGDVGHEEETSREGAVRGVLADLLLLGLLLVTELRTVDKRQWPAHLTKRRRTPQLGCGRGLRADHVIHAYGIDRDHEAPDLLPRLALALAGLYGGPQLALGLEARPLLHRHGRAGRSPRRADAHRLPGHRRARHEREDDRGELHGGRSVYVVYSRVPVLPGSG
mmetsp:Transcript_6568/g.16650  ORF Transcript_6568/g.16650 Transcript_6568/m.16650 type:complete len:274 (-) Transcript_6568:122-943(-)